MAQPKKGALMQFMFPMVDRTDFATIESGITASDFNSAATRKWYGINHGGSAAFTSGSISKATTLVHSGVFAQTLNATETAYDFLMVRFTHASCAEQIMTFQLVDYDDSDLMSRVSDLSSDLRSYLAGMSGVLSDVYSALSDFQSDFGSRVPKAVATASRLLLAESVISDAHSAAAQANSRALVLQSNISDLDSALTSQFVWTSNFLSDMNSDLRSYLLGMSGMLSDVDSQLNVNASALDDVKGRTSRLLSNVSDVDSALTSQFVLLSDFMSDIQSRVPKAVATNSQVSDLASDLRSYLVGMSGILSDVQSAADSQFQFLTGTLETLDGNTSNAYSAAAQASSRAMVIESTLSDIDSSITSNASDLKSAIGAITVTLDASDISDIASAVLVGFASNLSDILSAAQQTNSRVLVAQSSLSDIYSLLSDVSSDVVVMSGILSDVYSNLAGGVTIGASSLSDISSRVNAEVLNVINSDVFGEPTGAPAASTTINGKVGRIYQLLRNKLTVTADVKTFYADDGSVLWSKSLADNGTTFTEDEGA